MIPYKERIQGERPEKKDGSGAGRILEFWVFFFYAEILQECALVLIPGVGMWGCFLSTAADYDLPHALAEGGFVSCR